MRRSTGVSLVSRWRIFFIGSSDFPETMTLYYFNSRINPAARKESFFFSIRNIIFFAIISIL
jgi:hypothetical protein